MSKQKIKLILKPQGITCSGRRLVECHYRGTVVFVEPTLNGVVRHIKFKSHGQYVMVGFINNFCQTSGWEDLKIKDYEKII